MLAAVQFMYFVFPSALYKCKEWNTQNYNSGSVIGMNLGLSAEGKKK
jgi:hypothetical protein